MLGLCRGLLSGLLSTTSGAFEVPARGWLPVKALDFFSTCWASVSISLRRQKGIKGGGTIGEDGNDKGRNAYSSFTSSSAAFLFLLGLRDEKSKATFVSAFAE